MEWIQKKEPAEKTDTNSIACLSCGIRLTGKKRKYCSVDCRQELRAKLTMHTGLLKALNVRYATFSFSAHLIILDILPYGARQLFSYLYPRTKGKKPGDDFILLATSLGNLWWNEKKKTNKKYLASRQVLNVAEQPKNQTDSIKPMEIRIPTVKGKSFLQLHLSKEDLESDEYHKIIKKMYRQEVKKHHPDRGGSPAAFRKIHQAYEELLNWSENPTFINRRGFPDRWFYNGNQNRWVQPIPHSTGPPR